MTSLEFKHLANAEKLGSSFILVLPAVMLSAQFFDGHQTFSRRAHLPPPDRSERARFVSNTRFASDTRFAER